MVREHDSAQQPGTIVAPEEITVESQAQLTAEIRRLLQEGSDSISIDLSAVAFLDSSGLGVLVSCLKEARRGDAPLKLLHPRPRITHVLEVTRLDTLFEVVD